jgi:Na+-translocating ferredoxin:NAD+ oxidoreductase RNF subunit RnfB
MDDFTHGFRINPDTCEGCLSCMRACPTHAIRVRHRKARYKPDRCIDCGACLSACPSHAISATTWSVEDLGRFKFKVAVPSPVLFAQFPRGITSAQVVNGLLALGFDAVWDYSVDVSLVARAIQQHVEAWKGDKPLISISCPVVVRLVQVLYPLMVNQLVPIELPREIAGREAKRQYSARLGLRESEIAAIYITPCQAKAISILQPAEDARSYLDGTLGIADVYNGILASAMEEKRVGSTPQSQSFRNSTFLRWHISEGLGHRLAAHQHLRVTGLSNIIQVFDDIEKGKLRNVDFLEPYNCWTGCMGGNLTVANVYVTRSTVHGLVGHLPRMDPETEAEIERRYLTEDFLLQHRIGPRPIQGRKGSLKERVKTLKQEEATLASLPGLNCGLCGAPTCKELARDVGVGDATKQDCVFLSKDRLRELQRTYLHRTPSA